MTFFLLHSRGLHSSRRKYICLFIPHSHQTKKKIACKFSKHLKFEEQLWSHWICQFHIKLSWNDHNGGKSSILQFRWMRFEEKKFLSFGRRKSKRFHFVWSVCRPSPISLIESKFHFNILLQIFSRQFVHSIHVWEYSRQNSYLISKMIILFLSFYRFMKISHVSAGRK